MTFVSPEQAHAPFGSRGIAGYFRLMPVSHQYHRVRALSAAGVSIDAICFLTGWGPLVVRETLESLS